MENPSNNDDNNSTRRSISEKIQDYLLKNPWLVIWNGSLLVGGLIFWIYFFQIQYFPDLTGNESILLLPLAAMTGMLFIVLLSFIIMSPSLFRWIIVSPENLRKDLNTNDKKDDYELFWYFFSIGLFYAAAFLIAGENIILLLVISLLLQVLIYCLGLGKCSVFVGWFFSCFFSLFPLHLLSSLNYQNENVFWLYFLVLIMNYIFSLGQERYKKNWWFLSIPVFSIMVLIGIMKDPLIPKMVFSSFQLGNFPVARLLLDEKGCEIIEKMDLACESSSKNKKVCIEVKKHNISAKGCYLENIHVLSRMGKDFLLKVESSKDNNMKIKIPKVNVLSWLTCETKTQGNKKNDDPTQTASDHKKDCR